MSCWQRWWKNSVWAHVSITECGIWLQGMISSSSRSGSVTKTLLLLLLLLLLYSFLSLLLLLKVERSWLLFNLIVCWRKNSQKEISLNGNKTLNLHYRYDAPEFEIFFISFFVIGSKCPVNHTKASTNAALLQAFLSIYFKRLWGLLTAV